MESASDAAAAVEQRNAHQEHRRRRAAQHQVLERRLRALRPLERQQHQHVDRQRHDLEAEEQREEAVRGEQQAEAVQRRQQQRVEAAVVGEVVARQQQHGQRQRQHDRLGERARRVDREVSGERRARRSRSDAQQRGGRGGRGHGGQRDRQRAARLAREDLEHDQHDDAREQQVLRRIAVRTSCQFIVHSRDAARRADELLVLLRGELGLAHAARPGRARARTPRRRSPPGSASRAGRGR